MKASSFSKCHFQEETQFIFSAEKQPGVDFQHEKKTHHQCVFSRAEADTC